VNKSVNPALKGGVNATHNMGFSPSYRFSLAESVSSYALATCEENQKRVQCPDIRLRPSSLRRRRDYAEINPLHTNIYVEHQDPAMVRRRDRR